MKILVYGSKGWIGQQFMKLVDEYNTVHGKSRLDNISDVEQELRDKTPTHVFCFIGRTHGKIGDKVYTTIDYLEQPGKLVDNIRDNLFSPITLAKLCDDMNIHLTYLGTGCIFKYDDDHPFGKEVNGFTEDSKPNFFGSGYSIVKGFTDQLMALFPKVLNLRIRMPITGIPNSRNFITKITTYEKICSIQNSMTVLPELLPIALKLALSNQHGTLNLTNPGTISHNDILDLYKKYSDPNFTWENFSIEEQNKILLSKRSNNKLNTSKLEKMYPNVLTIHNALKICFENYTNLIF